MAQRLVRTIDKDYNEVYNPTKEELDLIDFPKSKIKSTKFHRGIPHRSNHNTGYKGRTAIHEIMEIDSTIKKLIFDGADQTDIKAAAMKNGMTPLRDAGIEKIINGTSSIDEIIRATVEDI